MNYWRNLREMMTELLKSFPEVISGESPEGIGSPGESLKELPEEPAEELMEQSSERTPEGILRAIFWETPKRNS